MKSVFLCIFLSISVYLGVYAQATGDISFIGFNADTDDDFAIVVLNDLPANTTIYFRDGEWNGTGPAFSSSDEGSGI